MEGYLSLLSQALNALEAIHQENLVHRDIKPSNFMIQGETLKLIDFGSVKSLEAEERLRAGLTMTSTGEMVGTPQYMSPEQFEKNFAKISSATDIYCLGVSLFEILTGALPFRENSGFSYGQAHLKKSPPSPSSLNSSIPPWLDSLLLKMLEKKPAQRPTLSMIRQLVESNRPENVEKALERGNRLIRQLVVKGLVDETRKEIHSLLSDLESRLAGASEGLQDKLKEFISETEAVIASMEEGERAKAVRISAAFNPYLCPNMACHAPVEEGSSRCPSCTTSYLMKCLCDRREETSYFRDVCQKCRERRPIPIKAKQKHSLFVTVEKCLEEKAYTEALAYFGFFPELDGDSEVAFKKAEVTRLHEAYRREEQSRKMKRVEEGAKNLIRQREEEDEGRRKKRLLEEDKERKAHLSKMEGMITCGEFNDAFDYYQKDFPHRLKDTNSAGALDRVCHHLTKSEIERAISLAEREKPQEAVAILKAIPPEYASSALFGALQKIHLIQAGKMEERGKSKKALSYLRTVIPGLKEEIPQSYWDGSLDGKIAEIERKQEEAREQWWKENGGAIGGAFLGAIGGVIGGAIWGAFWGAFWGAIGGAIVGAIWGAIWGAEEAKKDSEKK